MSMEQHIRELKAMRQVCREEGHTEKSLAEKFGTSVQSVFDVLHGTTKEGELRDKVLAFLMQNSDALADVTNAAPRASGETTLHAAWKAADVSQGELAKRFNRHFGTINQIIVGKITDGPLFEAVRAHLIDGAPIIRFPDRGQKKAVAPTLAIPAIAPAAPMPTAERPPLTTAPSVTHPLGSSNDFEMLMAQAMAAEELAESLKDLALLRQAERRYAAAVAIAQSVGLRFDCPERKLASA